MEIAPRIKDLVKALLYATVGLFLLSACVVSIMWLYHLLFDFDHLGEFNAKITGRAVYADSASTKLQELGTKKVEQYKKLQSPTK